MEPPKTRMKKIKIDDLKIGMFIVQKDRSWIDHPFFTSQKKITSEKQIKKLKEYGILEVYIDPQKGLDVSSAERAEVNQNSSAEKLDSVTSWEAIVETMEGKSSPQEDGEPTLQEVPLDQEMEAAGAVQREAHLVIKGVMEDIRLGKNIESEGVKLVVSHMIDSIFRNRDALASLTQIKGYDDYTFVHSINVCILCLTLGRHLDSPRQSLQEIGIGALLHDAGKTRIPLSILNKPGKLTPEERTEINKHPIYSQEILEKCKGIPPKSIELTLQHHERYNGQGYPSSLQGDEIAYFAQMAAIVDVYDAVTTDRVYKKAMLPHEGVKEIYRFVKTDFNPLLVERFIQCIGIYPVGTPVLLDTGEIGIVLGINPKKLLRPEVLLLYQNSTTRYPQPIPVDLEETLGDSKWFKRAIVMPIDPQQWNIQVEDTPFRQKKIHSEFMPRPGYA